MNEKVLAVDWETFYDTKQGYGIKELGTLGYLEHRLFDPYMISVSDGKDSWAGKPTDLNWDALDGQHLVSHNAYFDSSVYAEAAKRGMVPKIKPSQWDCTANLTSFLCDRRDLASSVEFLLKVKVSKDVRNYMDGKTWAQAKAEGMSDKLLAYARTDAVHCFNLWDKYQHLWPEHERKLSRMTVNQGVRGVYVDQELLSLYIVEATNLLHNTERLLPWINDGKSPTSTKAIAEKCRDAGIPCPPIKVREGQDAFDDWERAYAPKFDWIKAVANWRSINKFLGQLETIKGWIRADGTMPFSLKYFGGHTGRWSGGGGFNMQNMKKEPLLMDASGLLVTDKKKIAFACNAFDEAGVWPEFVRTALDIRKLFIPRPGKKFIICDLSQIEPRVEAWLVGDTALMELLRGGMSVYESHARATMGWEGGVLKKEDKKKYALAKARVLGLGFGCGWEKFIAVAWTLAQIDITENDPEFVTDETGAQVSGYGFTSKQIVKDFRDRNPKTVAFWNRLNAALEQSAGRDFSLKLPSGRSLNYTAVRRSPRSEKTEDGKTRMRWQVTADVGGKRTHFYGGKLTENAVQATARDVFGHHLLELQDAGADVVFHVHDEAINEVEPDVTVKDIEKIMSRCPDWLEGCPVAAEGVEAPCYMK